MKCKRAHWTSGLELLKHAVDTRSSMPPLQSCLIEAEAGKALLSASDLETEIRVMVPCEGTIAPTSLNWKSILQLSKAIKGRDGNIMLEATETGVRLAIGKRSFELGACEHPPPTPFASIVEGTTHALEAFDAERLARGFKFVLAAISKDDSRFHLAQPCLLGDGRLVATDGHRMHVAEKIGGFTSKNKLVPISTRSGPALIAAIKATGAVHVMGRAWVKSRIVEYSLGGVYIDVHIREKSIQADFPPIDQLIPEHTDSYEVSRAALADSIATLIKVHKATGVAVNRPVELLVNGALQVGGEGFSETLALARKAPREQRVGVAANYMLEAIAGDEELLEVFYGGELEPVIIRAADDLLGLVMPARLD